MYDHSLPYADITRIKQENEGGKVFTFNEYQEMSKSTIPVDRELNRNLTELALGNVCEAAETGDFIKKVVAQGHEMNVEKIKEEFGDQLWYMSAICSLLGITLEEVATHNVYKLRKRYNGSFSEESSIKRVDVNE